MRRRSLLFAALLCVAACSNNSSVKSPTTPTTPTTPSASVAGRWVGSATDSTGSMMGSGLGNQATMTWVLTQNGDQVTGTLTVAFISMTPGQTTPTVTGTMSGNTLTFGITMPAGSMPPPNGACSATANGTMTLNTAGTSMTGTYSGSSSCIGGFANGQITLTRP